jgi:hypothetical protein
MTADTVLDGLEDMALESAHVDLGPTEVRVLRLLEAAGLER